MRICSVCCDMNASMHNYAPFLERLRALGAQHGLQALWLVESSLTAKELSDDLRAMLHAEDRLLVIEIGPRTPWAATRLDDEVGPWLIARRP